MATFKNNDDLGTYGYDKASQVVSATYSGSSPPPNVAETYDPNGNRIGNGYLVGANNLLTSDGTFNYTHDNEGNVIKRVRISSDPASDFEVDYSWDYRNRLTDVYFYNNSHVLTKQEHLVYDVFNNLIEQDVDPTGGGTFSQVTHNVWDITASSPLPPGEGQGEGGQGEADAAMGANVGSGAAAGSGEGGIVMQFNGQQQLTNRYLNGPNTSASDAYFSTLAEEAVNSLTTPGAVTFDLADNLGSVRNAVSATGALLDHVNYDVFGAIASESNPSVHHLTGFAGGITDPNTGFDLFSERNYDPATGRFIQPDHIGLAGGDANEERYVGNATTYQTDPSGLDPLGSSPGVPPNPAANYGAIARNEAAIAAKNENAWDGLAPKVNDMSFYRLHGCWLAGKLPPVVVLDGNSPITKDIKSSGGIVAARARLLDRARGMDGLADGSQATATERGGYNPDDEVGGPSAIAALRQLCRTATGDAQGYIGSYSFRSQMTVDVRQNKRNKNGVVIRVRIDWEVWDPKSVKSMAAYFPGLRGCAKNENRPFYGASTVQLLMRWTEYYDLLSPLAKTYGPPSDGLDLLPATPSGDGFRVPIPDDVPFESDSGTEKRPPAGFQNGDGLPE